MFRRLRIKLTVLYTGLFCGALILSSLTAYTVVATHAETVVSEQLQSTSAVFDRLWQVRFGQLEAGAALSARDYGFRQAVATQDIATIRSALQNLRHRLGADLVYLVTPDGRAVNADEHAPAEVSSHLQQTLGDDDASAGVVTVHGALHQAVTASIYAPNLLGWIVVAQRLDQREMHALEHLSSIPLRATALSQSQGDWRSGDESLSPRDSRAIDAFVAHAMQTHASTPGRIDMSGGPSIGLVKPLRALDGTSGALLMRYPLASAMAPYRDLFSGLAVIALIGLALLVVATWALANGITKPLSALGEAARRLQAGEAIAVPVRGEDEIALLASSFNSMAAAIQERERTITDLALADSETGMPNRRALQRRLERIAALREGQRLYVAAIAVDRFPQIRGAIGYDLASSLIGALGARISKLAPKAPLGRVASDTIGMAFLAGDDASALERVAKLQSHIERPIEINGQPIDVEATVGLAEAAPGGETPAAMIARANAALDQARAARVKAGLFDPGAYGDPAANLSLMGEMRRALISGDIHLAFQPKLNLRTRSIEGAEAFGALAPSPTGRHRARSLRADG
jgi:GGDEF domain-containing protein